MTTRTITLQRLVRTLLVGVAGASALAACDKDPVPTDAGASFFQGSGPDQGTFYGAAVKVGDGIGRSYFTVAAGTVVEVGVALSEAALRGLPSGHAPQEGEHHHSEEYVLKMHPQNPTPYQHVGLNWVPNGHAPAGIYDTPHFDFHFYMISQAERAAIGPSDPLWIQKARNLPAAEFIPQNYVSTHVLAGVMPEEETFPRMGLHWIDVTSPELNGEPFTATFIYGSYDGKVIFAEPMITNAFLESKPNFTRELPKAQQGYNPGSYRVYWNAARKEYRVALTDLPAQ
jgi:hypothetical protein